MHLLIKTVFLFIPKESRQKTGKSTLDSLFLSPLSYILTTKSNLLIDFVRHFMLYCTDRNTHRLQVYMYKPLWVCNFLANWLGNSVSYYLLGRRMVHPYNFFRSVFSLCSYDYNWRRTFFRVLINDLEMCTPVVPPVHQNSQFEFCITDKVICWYC